MLLRAGLPTMSLLPPTLLLLLLLLLSLVVSLGISNLIFSPVVLTRRLGFLERLILRLALSFSFGETGLRGATFGDAFFFFFFFILGWKVC